MRHFHQAIPGWFDFSDLYAEQVRRIPSGGHVVEVGAFLGKSSAFLAVEIANSGKRLQCDIVDTWQGIDTDESGTDMRDVQEAAIAAHGSLFDACAANLAPVAHIVTLRQMGSLQAAATYPDASLDFVYLDNDHSTPHVYAEVMAWWPKIKPSGVIAGHDFNWREVKQGVVSWAKRTGVIVTPVSTHSWAAEKHDPGTSWTRPKGQRSCLVAVACAERTIIRETAQSLIELSWGRRVTDAAAKHGFHRVDFTWASKNVRVDALRDGVLYEALAGDYSHVLFLDADMVWPADVIDRMLAHHARGMTGGIYFLKHWPHSPVAMKTPVWNATKLAYDYTYDDEAVGAGAIRRVDLIGMGCTLIPMEAVRRLERPWFEYANDANGYPMISEDVPFCQKLSALGCPIWIDPTIACGHMAIQCVTEGWQVRSAMERQAVAAARIARGEDHGLAETLA